MNIKSRLRGSIPAALLLTLAAAALLALNGTVRSMERLLPEALVLRAPEGLSLSFRELREDLPPEGQTYSLAALRQSWAANARARYEGESVDLILTDEHYGEIAPLEMLYGNYFLRSDTPEENRFIVISDKLAVRFFLTDNAVGNTLRVNGTDCRICGVYRAEEGLLAEASSSGREAVYAPFDLDPEAVPQLLYVRGGDASIHQSIADGAAGAFGHGIGWETISAYPEIQSMARQLFRGVVFLWGIPVVLLVSVCLFRQGKAAVLGLQAGRRSLRECLLCLPWLAGLAAVLLLICFPPEIPPQYLPADNIFDFPFYTRTILQALQARNAAPICDFYWNLSHIGLLACLAWGAVSLALFLLAFWELVRWLKAQA